MCEVTFQRHLLLCATGLDITAAEKSGTRFLRNAAVSTLVDPPPAVGPEPCEWWRLQGGSPREGPRRVFPRLRGSTGAGAIGACGSVSDWPRPQFKQDGALELRVDHNGFVDIPEWQAEVLSARLPTGHLFREWWHMGSVGKSVPVCRGHLAPMLLLQGVPELVPADHMAMRWAVGFVDRRLMRRAVQRRRPFPTASSESLALKGSQRRVDFGLARYMEACKAHCRSPLFVHRHGQGCGANAPIGQRSGCATIEHIDGDGAPNPPWNTPCGARRRQGRPCPDFGARAVGLESSPGCLFWWCTVCWLWCVICSPSCSYTRVSLVVCAFSCSIYTPPRGGSEFLGLAIPAHQPLLWGERWCCAPLLSSGQRLRGDPAESKAAQNDKAPDTNLKHHHWAARTAAPRRTAPRKRHKLGAVKWLSPLDNQAGRAPLNSHSRGGDSGPFRQACVGRGLSTLALVVRADV